MQKNSLEWIDTYDTTKYPEFGTKSEGGIYGELGKLDHLGRPQDACILGYNFR